MYRITYSDPDGDKANCTKTQIISVPNYDELTLTESITCDAWDGYKGGIVVLRAQKIIGASDIVASELGFRGTRPTTYPTEPNGEGYQGRNGTRESGAGNYSSGVAGGGGHGAGAIVVFCNDTSQFTGALRAKGQMGTGGHGGAGAGGSVMFYSPSTWGGTIDVSGNTTHTNWNGYPSSSIGREYQSDAITPDTKQYILGAKIAEDLDSSTDLDLLVKSDIVTIVETLTIFDIPSGNYDVEDSKHNAQLKLSENGNQTVNLQLQSSETYRENWIATINPVGSGTKTISVPVGVTLNGVDGGSTTFSAQYKPAVLQRLSLNAWQVYGAVEDVV